MSEKTIYYIFKGLMYSILHQGIRIITLPIFTIILLAPTFTYGQDMLGGEYGKGIQMSTQSYGYISQIPLATTPLKGSSYLFENWLPSHLDFGSIGSADGLKIRYDVLNSIFHLKLNDQIKSINSAYIKKFSVTDTAGITHNYINCNQFKMGQIHLIGFFEILDEGNYSLFKKTSAEIVKSNYVMALDLGEENDNISQHSDFYISRKDEVFKVPSSKKKLAALFPEKKDLHKHMKVAKINIHRAGDLKELVQYMNQ